jgi:ribosomal protein S18 acetylase RimI-like enzyme
MSISIYQATINDLKQLVPLFDAYRVFYKQPSDKEGAEKFLFERFEHGESVIFMAKDNEEAVGFTQLYPIFSSVSMQRLWLLNDLFVMEQGRRKGIAEKLMNAAKDFAILTRAKGLTLSTAIDNHYAQRLYERLGYKKDDDFVQYFLRL